MYDIFLRRLGRSIVELRVVLAVFNNFAWYPASILGVHSRNSMPASCHPSAVNGGVWISPCGTENHRRR